MAKILMADDEPSILNMAGGMLRDMGHEVITVSDGRSAYEKTMQEKPDLVILDRNMPVMGGIEACSKIRQSKEMYLVPVLFLTAQDTEKEILEGRTAGANDYIIKPFNMTELKERVTALLEKAKK